ncbi:hypothetical protein K450DRAFT_223580 [Umbelopsis ramanniana AG]|uniref:Succinate dehydrogenase subunit C n=1 Tax=Umbelopsis ramanniana AG TaxID=1314678 RepID=A0AAD5EJD8_UMBRA|nr:uncharacterized protein K450DRAFT_223580 [Umbelopsis ramanniana AG]KAI8583420.1 hypothetical protein K450DRAFT_223580 [Umbelopsis ramanniana AG]
MFATRAVNSIVAQNVARTALFKNASAVPTGIRAFRATPSTMEQSPDAESELLRQQRLVRPKSPHLTIYQPQLTWLMSGFHRITGCAVGAGFYVGALSYLALPALGYNFDTSAIVASVASLPVVAKVGIKTTVAFPFVFHCLNGVRHLIWDTGRFLTVDGVYKTGYAVLGSSAAITLYLASL